MTTATKTRKTRKGRKAKAAIDAAPETTTDESAATATCAPAKRTRRPRAAVAAARQASVDSLPRAHPLRKAIKAAPSQLAFQKHLGVTPQGLYALITRSAGGTLVPPAYVLRVCGVGGSKPHACNPDAYLKDWAVPAYEINDDGERIKVRKARTPKEA